MLVSQAPVKFLSSPDLFTSPYTRKALRVLQITQSEFSLLKIPSSYYHSPFPFAAILSNSLSLPKSGLFFIGHPYLLCNTAYSEPTQAREGRPGTVDQRTWLESL